MFRNKRLFLMTIILLTVSLIVFRPILADEPPKLVFLTFESPVLTASFWDNAIKAAIGKSTDYTVQRIVSPGVDRTTYAKQLLASDQFPDLLQSINTHEV